MTTAGIVFAPRLRPDARALAAVVTRAREGDREALVYVFDNVFYDVYHHVFLATRSRRDAERITREALDRLPSLLRRDRFLSVEDLRDSLVEEAERKLRGSRRTGAPVRDMAGPRAVIRHAVLISSAVIAATGALILVT